MFIFRVSASSDFMWGHFGTLHADGWRGIPFRDPREGLLPRRGRVALRVSTESHVRHIKNQRTTCYSTDSGLLFFFLYFFYTVLVFIENEIQKSKMLARQKTTQAINGAGPKRSIN